MAQVQPIQQVQQTQPTQQAKPAQQANAQPVDEPSEDDVQSIPKWYSKWWVWLIIAAAILLVGFGIWYFLL